MGQAPRLELWPYPQMGSGYVDLHLTTGQSSREFHEIIPPPPTPDDDGETSAPPWRPGSPAHGRNLRIALTMKGGVSLAVWIGGAVAELDVLRRIRIYRDEHQEDRALLIFPRPHLAVGNRPSPEPTRSGDWGAFELEFQRADIYARALHRLQYDRVDIDILAGASAGGLNAVLYGVAQRAGVSVSSLLDTWMTAASAWDLLQVNHPTRSPDAVFQGDDYFWPQVYDALKTIASDRASETHAVKAEHVVIDLAATLIDSRDTVETNASSGRADFRFVAMPDDNVKGRSIPAPLPATEDAADGDDAVEQAAQRTEFEQDLARLAYAARATSSFPGAFEPALIYSSTNPFDTTASAGPPNMRTAFNAHRPDGFNRPFRVVDGGVFDNIPIARTLRAILNNPAETYSDTAILYLDPSPKEETTWLVRPTEYSGPPPVLPPDKGTNRNDPPSRFLPSLIATLNKRRIGETGASETERVDDMRIAALFSDGRARPLAFDQFTDNATWLQAYANYRAAADAQLLIPVFRRPGEWALGTNLPERPLRTARGRESLVLLEQELGDLLRGPATPDGAIREGAQGLVDATRCALAWLRSIEDTMFHVTPRSAATEPPLDEESPISIADHHEDFRDLRRRISKTLRATVDERDRRIANLLTFAETNVSDPAQTWTREQARKLAVEWVRLDAGRWTAAETHWNILADILSTLTEYSSDLEHYDRWRSQPWSALGNKPSLSPRSLPLLFPVSGVASRNEPIRFHRVGSDAQPAAPERFTRLMHGQLLNAYRAGLAKPPRDLTLTTVSNLFDESRLRSTSKLAGSTLSNFAGFLSSDWRVNDWWWGRMDAAAGILSFLETTPHVDDQPAISGQLRPLQDALLQEMNAEIEARRPFPKRLAPKPPRTTADPDEIRRRMDRGAQNLSALHSGYLVALASRATRTLSSTMARAQVWVSPKRFLHWLLRPILVLVPTALDPPRLTIVAILVACGALLAWPSRPFDLANFDLGNRTLAEIIPRVVVFAAIVAIPITRFIAAGIANRRARHRILIHTSGQVLSRQVIAEAERRARRSRWPLVTLSMLLAVATATTGVVLGFVGALFWVGLIGTLAVTEVATRSLQTAPLARVGRAKWWVLVGVAGTACLVAAFWLSTITVESAEGGGSPGVADELEAPLALPLAAGYASIAFAIGIALFIGTMRVRSMLGISLAGAMVAGAVCIAFLAFARDAWFYDYTPIGEQSVVMRLALITTANVLLVAWTTGTLYWLAPWRRGAVASYGARRADGRSTMDRVIER